MISNCLSSNNTMRYSIYNIISIFNRVMLILAGWNILIAYIEANFWHFTEPAALRFRLAPAIIFFLVFFLPGLFTLHPNIWNFQLPLIQQLIFAILEPLFLLIASLPYMDDKPTIRTGFLGGGSFLLPFVMRFSRSKQNIHAALEFFLAVYISICVRWSYHAVNVFYEEWKVSGMLFIIICIFSVIQVLMKSKLKKEDFILETNEAEASTKGYIAPTPRSERSDTTETDLNLPDFKYRKESAISSNLCPMIPSDKSEMGSKMSLDSKDEEDKGLVRLASFVTMFMAPGIASFLTIFVQFFTSPAQLIRWSGYRSDPYGFIVVISCTVSFLLAIYSKYRRQQSILKSFNYQADCAISKNLFSCTTTTLILIMMITTGFVLLLKFEGFLALLGVGFVSLSLPFAFIKVIGVYIKSCRLCCSVFRGLAYILGSLCFLINLIALTSFNLPTITNFFFGRMDIILSISIALVCLSVMLSGLFFYLYEQRKYQVEYEQLVCSDIIFFLTITILSLITSSFLTYHLHSPFNCRIDESKLQGYEQDAHNTTILRAMSWNILLGHTYTGRDNSACIANVLRHYSPTIIGLQESDPLPVFWGGKDVLGVLASELSNEGIYSFDGVPALKSTLGVALMGKLKLISHEAHLLPNEGYNKLPHYGYTRTRFEIPNHSFPLNVINVHAVYKNWTAGNFTELSTIQIERIAQVANDFKDSREPFIVLGDFNLNPYEPQLDPLWKKANLKCVFHERRQLIQETTLLNRFGNVDHIFYRNLDLIQGKVVSSVGKVSDHYPILADFVMPGQVDVL